MQDSVKLIYELAGKYRILIVSALVASIIVLLIAVLCCLSSMRAQLDGLIAGLSSSGEEAFRMASDVTRPDDERSFLYLNAIYHEPDNSSFYKGYASFLYEQDDEDGIWELREILYSAMLQLPAAILPDLLEIYDELGEYGYDYDEGYLLGEGYDYQADFDNAVCAFFDYGEGNPQISDYETFGALYESVMDAESMLGPYVYGNEVDQIDAIFTLVSLQESADRIRVEAEAMDDDGFIALCPVYLNSLNSAVPMFAYRDKEGEGSYSSAIDHAFSTVCSAIAALQDRHDDIICAPVLREAEVLLDDARGIYKNNRMMIEQRFDALRQKHSNAVSSLLSGNSNERYVLPLQACIDEIASLVSRQQYIDYNSWAAGVIIDAEASMPKADAEKLNFLYEQTAFIRINPSLLSPGLSRLYYSIYTDSVITKSATPAAELAASHSDIIPYALGDV